jgi:hypothetical protein
LVYENVADPIPAESAVAIPEILGRSIDATVHVVARVIGAFVAVVAHDTFTGVLSAHAGYTDAGNAIEVAVRSVVHRDVVARTGRRITVPRAFIAVIFAHDVCAEVAHAVYTDPNNPIGAAVPPLVHRVMDTPHEKNAIVSGTIVAVVAPPWTITFQNVHTPNERNHAQRADT